MKYGFQYDDNKLVKQKLIVYYCKILITLIAYLLLPLILGYTVYSLFVHV